MQVMLKQVLPQTTKILYNNRHIGSSASGKPTAFGAVIPQVRILSTQQIKSFLKNQGTLIFFNTTENRKRATGFEPVPYNKKG